MVGLDVKQLFELASKKQYQDLPQKCYRTVEKGHGGIEVRSYRVMGNSEYLLGAEKWSGLRSVGMVESENKVKGKITSIERRYYLLSFECDVERFALWSKKSLEYRKSTALDFRRGI